MKLKEIVALVASGSGPQLPLKTSESEDNSEDSVVELQSLTNILWTFKSTRVLMG